MDAVGRGKLNQTQPAGVRIKLGGFSIEANGVLIEELINNAAQVFSRGDELILRVHP